jgi:hypothetical protein
LEASFTDHLFNAAEGSPVDAMYYSWLDYPYYRDLIYGQNYFGDPTLTVYQSTPIKPDIEIHEEVSSYMTAVTAGGNPVEDAEVYLSSGGTILLNGTTDKKGKLRIPIELGYGTEYCISVVKSGYTIGRLLYTPTLTLDVENEEEPAVPEDFSLSQNYPNPFNPVTVVEYDLPQKVDVTFEIYNILGQLIFSCSVPNQPAGQHSITWPGINNQGRSISSGIYLYRMTAADFTDTKKMVLMK